MEKVNSRGRRKQTEEMKGRAVVMREKTCECSKVQSIIRLVTQLISDRNGAIIRGFPR